MTVIVVVLVIFFIFLAMRVPIGASMAIASIIGFISIDFNLATVGSVVYTAVSNQSLMCIPGYILAGALMSRGGIAKALIDCLKGWLGHIPGSLAIITTICCAFFAAITGSSTATVAAIGGLMMPAMLDDGYDENMTLGLTAASGTLGILIPPSIPMVLYCTVAGTAVSKQFTAGILPGLVIVIAYSIYSIIKSKKTQKGVTQRASMKERWQRTIYAIPAILLPVTILGSIYGGIMTATEASVWAIFYALVISIFVYKGFTFQDFIKCMNGKQIIPFEEAVKKIEAAAAARTDPDFVINARTDAVAVAGVDEAIRRGNAFAKAGATMIFVEAPTNPDEVKRVIQSIDAPVSINMIYAKGSKTPAISIEQLQEWGAARVSVPIMPLFAASYALRKCYTALMNDGAAELQNEIFTFSEFTDLVGLPGIRELEQRFVSGRELEARYSK